MSPKSGYGPDHPRFPGFDVLSQADTWDEVTRATVLSRLHPHLTQTGFESAVLSDPMQPSPAGTGEKDENLGATQASPRFFSDHEFREAASLLDQLVGQDAEPMVPVAWMVDARLAENSTDGWHYDNMPPDRETWQHSLRALDEDAREAHDMDFAACPPMTQRALLQAIQDLNTQSWHGLPANRVWNVWMRYACTAFYSHPAAWNEIGFDGPAYPRGYKNLHIDGLESFEVHDATPQHDPVRTPGPFMPTPKGATS